MTQPRAVVAVIGPLFQEGPSTDARAARERLEQTGATLVRAQGPGEDDLIASCANADVVMILGLAPFTERVFASLPRLSFLMQCTVGYDKIDVAAATRHGVIVANSPLFCIEEVSDHATMLLLACARKLSHQNQSLHVHGWHRQTAVDKMGPVYRIRGKTLGFVAFGRIARLTAQKMAGFGMTYVAHDPYLSPSEVRPWNVELVSLDEVCRRSDFVSMHAPLNESTRGMFGEPQFRAMKPTAYFVNTSRGGTVDEPALIRALREGWIAGAGLDVLEQEPPDPANPLLGMPNVLLTPHTAGYSEDSMADNHRQSVDKVVGFLEGRWPDTLINPAAKTSARARAFVKS
jgi:D-3-phosphoglycerate dehydrogenase / 2-oxoglutarate reductase